MLTRKQHELIRFIQTRLEETGVSPSFEEMKEALDLKSKSGVHRLISALEERGFIRRLPNRALIGSAAPAIRCLAASPRAGAPACGRARRHRAAPQSGPFNARASERYCPNPVAWPHCCRRAD